MRINDFVFLHIPKTAGTSFRGGLLGLLGSDNVCMDYGVHAVETSEIVKYYILDRFDSNEFHRAYSAKGFGAFCGHFPVSRYLDTLRLDRTFAIMRDPAERLYSEYRHFKRHFGYTGSFREFYTGESFINRQLRYFEGVSTEALALVGLTEFYEETLSMLQSSFDLEVPSLTLNKWVQDTAEVDEYREEIKRLNQIEYAVYDRVKTRFFQRQEAESRSEQYFRGEYWVYDNFLEGWAQGEEVEVEIYIGGVKYCCVKADDRVFNISTKVSRQLGSCGFSVDLPKTVTSEVVECRVKGVDQVLPVAIPCDKYRSWRV